MTNDQLTELNELIEDLVEYYCREFGVSQEEAYTAIWSYSTVKKQLVRGNRL